MSQIIELNPELLAQQSLELKALQSEYDSLLQGVTSDLKGINGSWSQLLSHNFSGKILSAQRSFSGVLSILGASYGAISLVLDQMGSTDLNLAGLLDAVLSSDSISEGAAGLSDWYDNLPKSLQSWIKKGKGELIKNYLKNNLNSDDTGVVSLLEEFAQVDWKGLMEQGSDLEITEAIGYFEKVFGEVGEIGMEHLVEVVAQAGDLGIAESDIGTYAKYLINLVENTAETATECLMGEPTIGKALNFAWGVSGGAILDTAGDKVYKTINLIPGVAEYYADKGVTDSASLGNVALGEYYRLISGNDEAADYAAGFYEEHGGLGGGIEHLGKEVFSFVKDSGGLGKAIESFGKAAITDINDALAYQKEVSEVCWNSAVNFFTRNPG